MINNKSEDYVNELFGAIDMILAKKIEQISFDKTIICTITDITFAKEGKYTVFDGAVKFDAYCENTSYKVDDQVRVLIPNGDNTQEKLILSKYTPKDSKIPMTYIPPLGSIMQVKTIGNFDKFNFIVDGEGIDEKNDNLIQIAHNNKLNFSDEDSRLLGSNIYDTVYIQADFRTLLSNFNVVSGEYALILILSTELKDGEKGEQIPLIFSSKDMVGNPYGFDIATTQAAKFDVSSIANKISDITLYFFQDGNFQHITNSLQPKPILPVSDEAYNLIISNITIGLGNNIMKIEDETVRLYSGDESSYNNGDEDSCKKLLELAWYNKNTDGKYVGFMDAVASQKTEDSSAIKYVKINDNDIKFVDEDAYQQQMAEYNRLKSEWNYDVPVDKVGLDLSARIKKTAEFMRKTSAYLSDNMWKLYNSINKHFSLLDEAFASFLQNQPLSVEQCSTNPGELIDTSFIETSLKESEEFYDYHFKLLKDAAHKVNEKILTKEELQQLHINESETVKPKIIENYFVAFKHFKNTLIKYLDTFTSNLTNQDKQGYESLRDSYLKQLKKVSDYIKNDLLEPLIVSFTLEGKQPNPTIKIIEYFDDKYEMNRWNDTPDETYNNGYCIYWYRYNPLAVGDNYMPYGWERIINTYSGLNEEDGSAKFEDIDFTNYKSINVLLDATQMKEERFKTLIFFNHNKYESNELIFKNDSEVENEKNSMQNASIRILHGTRSQESYQNYLPTGSIANAQDDIVSRELSVQFIEADGRVNNEQLKGAQIFWYLPIGGLTMLKEDKNVESAFRFSRYNANENVDIQNKKDDCLCYYKTILDTAEVLENELKFLYKVKNFYVSNAKFNTIYCRVIKNEYAYEASVTMNFTSLGTSGADYTLVVHPESSQRGITSNNTISNPWKIKIELYNSENVQVAFPTCPTVSLMLDSNVSIDDNYELSDDNMFCLCELYLINSDSTSELINYNILKCEANNVSRSDNTNDSEEGETASAVTLTTFFSIPYAQNENLSIAGADTVIYDSLGTNPVYYKDPYELYKFDMETLTTTALENLQYNILSINGDGKYLPTLSENHSLLPKVMYVDGTGIYFNSNKNYELGSYSVIEIKDDNGVLWQQPIIIMQNRYGSPMLNSWDGSLKIDEEGSYILSAMMGAGKKDNDNLFSGVLMGDFRGTNNTGLISTSTGLGLYGFHKGAQSFGFNVDGTAFIGKAGGGRIEFNGNQGFIYSDNWLYDSETGTKRENPFVFDESDKTYTLQPGSQGMAIDLKNGHIDAHNFKLTAWGVRAETYTGGIYLNSSPVSQEEGQQLTLNNYFMKMGREDKSLITVDSGGEIYIKANNFKLAAWDDDKGGGIYLNSAPTPLTEDQPLSLDNYFMKVGRSEGSLITIDNSGEVQIETKNFKLQAKTENSEVLIDTGNSNGNDLQFKILGKDGKGIYLDDEKNLQIDVDNLNVVVSALNINADDVLTINTKPSDGTYFKVGTSDHYFQFNKDSGMSIQTNNFKLTKSGLTLTGSITANNLTAKESGQIGQWSISPSGLHSGSGETYIQIGGTGYAIWAGANKVAEAPFSVTEKGHLYAYNATVSGTIAVGNGGSIGGWSVESFTITKDQINFYPSSEKDYCDFSGSALVSSMYTIGTYVDPDYGNVTETQKVYFTPKGIYIYYRSHLQDDRDTHQVYYHYTSWDKILRVAR